MRLDLVVPKERKHIDAVTAVAWSSAGELVSCSDDHQVLKWSHLADEVSQLMTLDADVFPTDMDWLPSQGGKKAQSELFALASADGRFRLVSQNGRVEKTVEAHEGACICIKWSNDGSALLTVGEDGAVKIWSRSGMLRSVLAQTSVPVYSAAWSPDSSAVLYTQGRSLVIKPLNPSAKTEQWKAHDGIILQVDWNAINNTIVSCGEDRRYKVWDSYGRPVYNGIQHDHPVTAVRWSPDGSVFAVGSFNTLRLCDRSGWSYVLEKPEQSGSVYSLAWTADSTRLAAGCAANSVVFAKVVERRLEWGSYEVILSAEDCITVRDVQKRTHDSLTDFRDRVVKMSLAHGHLVVCTTTQCLIYRTTNWHSPVTFDLKPGTVTLVAQAAKHFLLANALGDIFVCLDSEVHSYEGRTVCTPKVPNLRSELVNKHTVALSDDTICIRDPRDEKAILVFDVQSGKPLTTKPITHNIEVAEISLDQGGHAANRLLAVVDKNRDLFLTLARRSTPKPLAKLSTMVVSLAWQEATSMLATVSNGRFTVFYYPNVVFVDPGLLSQIRVDQDASDFGKNPEIVNYAGNMVTLRRADGALVVANVSPHPALLHSFIDNRQWESALRLCRLVKDPALWACLATMAAAARELNTAEVAFAAIDEIDKVEYIQQVKEIPTVEGRNAAMALFCQQVDEAEGILLKAGLVYRAIDMNCSLFRWDRALDLAVTHKTHVDTVLAQRQRYLADFKKKETSQKFKQYADTVAVDWPTIEAKIAQELETERSRPGAKPYA